uniref:C2H2-type domain-containing protein n=1 Tax=Glossina morsitans morsitans TaxID=37546 RepID=A0A1B0FMT4_GLOMM
MLTLKFTCFSNVLYDIRSFVLTWYQHSCDQCGKSYKTRKSLSRHRRFECRFTIERPVFQCPSCSYAAKRSDNLTKHIKTHFAKMQREFLPLAVKIQNTLKSQMETA